MASLGPDVRGLLCATGIRDRSIGFREALRFGDCKRVFKATRCNVRLVLVLLCLSVGSKLDVDMLGKACIIRRSWQGFDLESSGFISDAGRVCSSAFDVLLLRRGNARMSSRSMSGKPQVSSSISCSVKMAMASCGMISKKPDRNASICR